MDNKSLAKHGKAIFLQPSAVQNLDHYDPIFLGLSNANKVPIFAVALKEMPGTGWKPDASDLCITGTIPCFVNSAMFLTALDEDNHRNPVIYIIISFEFSEGFEEQSLALAFPEWFTLIGDTVSARVPS